MVQVKNIGRKTQFFSEPYNVRLNPGDSTDLPPEFAIKLATVEDFEVNWSSDDVRWKDKSGKVTHINYLSPFEPYDGYGIIGCYTAMNFEKWGIHVSIPNPVFPSVRAQLGNTYPKVLSLIDRPDRYPTRWGISHTIPPDIDLMPTPYRILHTMWEATLIPDMWQKYVERSDALILPSEGQVPIFRNSGYAGPIYTVIDGIDMDAYSYYERPNRDTFTFFTWGKMTSRKCPWELLSCFSNAFPKESDVRLIIKTREGHFGMGKTAPIPEIRDPRIRIINQNWPLHRLVEECHNVDCGIFLSRGEGFYNPPIQATATGLPCITPNHSGCSWATSKHFYPVGLDTQTPFVESTLGMRGGRSLEWWNMSKDETIETMRYVYNHRSEAKMKGKRAAAYVRKTFSIDEMMRQLTNVLQKLD